MCYILNNNFLDELSASLQDIDMTNILVGRDNSGAKLQPGNGRDVTEQGRRGGVYGVGGGPPRRGGRRGKREIGN